MKENKTSTSLANSEAYDKSETDQKHVVKLNREKLLAKANTLPKSPGCYLMQGKLGEILYVGKAKNLKSRVTSYFNNSEKNPKTQILVSHIKNFEFILTNSDAESYVLENNLIKEHKPKYNIRLKDDKSYPYLGVDWTDDFPRLLYLRRPKKRKNLELFGPFPQGYNVSYILRILTKSFALRDCSNHEFRTRNTPCILYQMNQCTAPCVDKISKEEYHSDLNAAIDFFKSKKKVENSISLLTDKMMVLAEEEMFEYAAQLRDHIEELTDFAEKSFEQNVESLSDSNVDVIAYHAGEQEIDISIYLIRQGNLLGQKNFHFLIDDLLDDIESEVSLAILQYYSQNSEVIPSKIITLLPSAGAKQLQEALIQTHGEGLKLRVFGQTKKYESLLRATREHAEQCQRVRTKNQDSVYVGLNRLKDLLKLKDRPKTLECYDIAIWQGKSPTAAQIVFFEGKPDRAQYRHYHLEERPEGNNDFAMMEEVFRRRLKYGNLPDVFIVDGGVAQVNTVSKVLEELKIDVPVVGIAKARDLKAPGGFRSSKVQSSDERLVIRGRSNPFILAKCPPLLRTVVHMRDEAHRFSRRLHHKAEKKRVLKSWVDEVKGLNADVRKQILKNNSYSMDELSEFNEQELSDCLEINSKHAKAVYQFLHALKD